MQDGRLGKYEILGTLGKGAMGVVYDGRDPIIDRRVAIKTIPLPDPDDAEAQDELARFKREAQAAGRLSHPNIVGVFDYGETDKIAFIVMEFVDGTSLKPLLERQERFPPVETVRIMQELLAGLQYSHQRGVVHRDIKPANIMLTKAGVVKIADFGIARIESSSMTQAGTIMGTPAYMSPEQFMGQTVDQRTDIYSAGVMLYQMLTGERPFEGSMTAIMHKALNTQPPRPSELSVTAPAGLDAVVATAMAKRPEQRYADAGAFSAALLHGLTAGSVPLEPISVGGDSDATMVAAPRTAGGTIPPQRPEAAGVPVAVSVVKSGRRLPLLAGAAAAALLVVAGGGYIALRGGSAPAEAVTPARPTAPLAISAASTQAVTAGVTVTPPPPLPVNQPPTTQPAVTVAAAPPSALPTAVAVVAASVATMAVPDAPSPPAPPVAAAAPPTRLAVARTPASLRAAIAAAISSIGCSLLGGDVDEAGRLVIDGVAPRAAEAELRRSVEQADPSARPDYRVATFNGPYCPLLDILRPATRRFGASGSDLGLGLKGGATRLRRDEFLIPAVTMPEFGGYLQLDYFASDGSLLHMHQGASEHGKPYPAHGTTDFGDPVSGAKGWQVDVPFGTDMIVAIASDQKLFAIPRPDSETPEAYLSDLRTALAAAAGRGGRVIGRAMVVTTVER